MSETLIILAVVAAGLGAAIATVKGYAKMKAEATANKKYSPWKLFSALITSIMSAFGSINLMTLLSDADATFPTIGYFGVFFTYLVFGYGMDKGIAELDH